MSKNIKKDTPKEEKQLAPKEPGALTLAAQDEWDLGSVDSRDIIIPKLLIMQSPSKLVQQEKAQFGDLVNSVTGEILGTAREKGTKPVKFIPIKEEKTWTVFELSGTKPEFRGSEPRTPVNDDLPREFTKDGKNFRRYRTLNYFVLLIDELEKTDMPLPYVLSFRSTSYKSGRVLSTHFLMCKAALQKGNVTPPPATTFELSGEKASNDKGTFYILQAKAAGETKPEHVAIAAQWLKTLRTKAYTVDETDAEVDAETEVTVDVNVRDVKPGEVQSGAEF